MRIFPEIHLAHASASQQARQAVASKLHSLEQHASVLNSCSMGGDVEYSGIISHLLMPYRIMGCALNFCTQQACTK
jgi:hypothetical protein